MADEQLIGFAARSRVQGGFGYLLADGGTDHTRGLETWINARMTHVFCLASLGGHDVWHLAEHGIGALRGALRDQVHGGWFRSTRDSRKAGYEHAFVVLAAASARVAGLGDGLLDEALDVWDGRFWDEAAGASVEAYEEDWTGPESYRGANSNMHGVEAMLAAADALPGRARELRGRALRVVERFVHREAISRDGRLPEHFDADWRPRLDYNRHRPADPFRPFGVTVGHQLEWARLAVHLASVLEDAPTWLTSDACALYAAAVRRGWAADGQPGLVYTLDWSDRPVVTARFHWVLAEAISAAHVLGQAQDAQRWEQLAQTTFLDPTTGNWHHELDSSGRLATQTWTGQPDVYHVYQSRLLGRIPVRGSIAAGLLAEASGLAFTDGTEALA